MKWVNIIPLLLFTALIVGVVFIVRPAARRRRHEAWEKAGLLPDQVDPDAPREAEPEEPDAGDESSPQSRPDGHRD